MRCRASGDNLDDNSLAKVMAASSELPVCYPNRTYTFSVRVDIIFFFRFCVCGILSVEVEQLLDDVYGTDMLLCSGGSGEWIIRLRQREGSAVRQYCSVLWVGIWYLSVVVSLAATWSC